MIFSNISSIDPGKGLDEFVCAVGMMNKLDGLFFEIVGKASGVNEAFEKRIHEKILAKNLESKISIKGFVENIGTYLNGIDVVVLSSYTEEALPTVLIEAMAKGKVIIATDVGGVKEIVEDSYGNIIVPPGNCTALKDALEKVSAYSIDQLLRIGRKNINIAKHKFKLDTQLKELSKLYMELCKK